MSLSVGQRVTLLRIDDCLAMTHRYELEVRSIANPVGTVVRQRGKRKDFYLKLAADDILLDGWDLPFRADTDGGGAMHGNACYNLVGDPEAIRQCIETRAAAPISDDAKAKIIVAREEQTTCADDGQLLYPEIETHHAVVNRMKGLD
jgi:hypothetical protein